MFSILFTLYSDIQFEQNSLQLIGLSKRNSGQTAFFFLKGYRLSSAYIICSKFWHFLKAIPFITKNCDLKIFDLLPEAKGKQLKGHWACMMAYEHKADQWSVTIQYFLSNFEEIFERWKLKLLYWGLHQQKLWLKMLLYQVLLQRINFHSWKIFNW